MNVATLLAKLNPYKYLIYVVLLAAVVLGLFFVYHKWTSLKGDLKLAESHLELIQQVNLSNQKTIRELEEQRRRDSAALLGLATDVDAIRRTTGATYSAIENLGATNEAVNDYLQRPVPDELRRLLDERTDHPE